MTKSQEQNPNLGNKTATRPVIEGAAGRQPEKDGAAHGYTYRLLKRDLPDYGLRGRIVTLTFAQAKSLKAKDAKIPTKSQIARGVL